MDPIPIVIFKLMQAKFEI